MTLLLLLGCADTVLLLDQHNYAFSSQVSATTQTVAARTDLEVSWADLTVDMQGRAIDPSTEVDELTILILQLSQQEILEALVTDALRQSDIVAFAQAEPPDGVTSLQLTDFDFVGNPVIPDEHVLPDRGTWLLSASTVGQPGARTLSFFDPIDDGPVVPLVLANDSAELDYQVDLAVGEPLALPTTALDWSDLTLDMRGLPIRLNKIDLITLAAFDEDMQVLQDDFLNLAVLSEQSFEAPLSATVREDLTTLTNSDGEHFTDIDDVHTWLLALRCSTCENPAPPFMARVQ